MNKHNIFITIFLVLISGALTAQSIVTTKHNLAYNGPGTVKATSENEICIFCHTPHNSRPNTPLWNRADPGSTYTLYASSTMQALPGQPDGSSILCLSCHDGTVALGSVLSRSSPISFTTGSFLPAGVSNLNKDLRNDHPISFLYTSLVATTDGELKDPSAITPPVSLTNGEMQCTSCHDPHVNINSDFLVTNPDNGALCNSCHTKRNWSSSSHSTSTKTWNGTSPNPWPYTPYTTVARNACENCHNPHNSGATTMLMKYQAEESNCMDCHNGNAATKNIATQLAKTYRHNVAGYTGVHDANEPAQVTVMHVECTDCHNPHQANATTALPPAIGGNMAGVKGIDQGGTPVNPAVNSYEVCYRCHAGSPGAPASSTPRLIEQNNTRLEFAGTNPSFHPVAAAGVNTSVPSLISPWTTTSRMNCTTCHASDGTSSPAGPHGSIYPHILKQQYITADNTAESATAYALCYSCHNRNYYSNEATSNTGNFMYHFKHVVEVRAPCNACHDPHGISNTQGNSTNNSNLINFSSALVTPPSGGGQIRFEDTGVRHGRCYLTCHSQNHNGYSY